MTGMRVAVGAVLSVGLLACGASKPGPTARSVSLSDFLGGGDTPAESQARMVAQMRKGQEKVAACMRAEGFVYQPFLGNFSASSFTGPKVGEEVAWKRKHGYGMAESMSQVSQPSQQPVDPNTAIRSALSKADQVAYDKALSGFDPANPPTGAFQPTGCLKDGFGGGGEESQALQAQLSSKFEGLSKRVAADPRVVESNREWSVCMKGHGYAMTSNRDIFEKILGPAQQKLFSSGLTGRSGVTAQPGSGTDGPGAIPAVKIEGLRLLELKVANADADCRTQSDSDALDAVRKEYEATFIAENRVVLEKLKAAQNG